MDVRANRKWRPAGILLGLALIGLQAGLPGCGPVPVGTKGDPGSAGQGGSKGGGKAQGAPGANGGGPTGVDANGAGAKTGPVKPAANLAGALQVPVAIAAELISDKGTGLIANNGSGIVANGGALAISNNGGALTARGERFGLQAIAARGLAGIEVELATLDGQPVPGATRALTDDQGRFELHVPEGTEGTVVVRAALKTKGGKQGSMKTIVRPADKRSGIEVNLASTFVSAVVPPGGFEPTAFGRAVQATADKLEESDAQKVFDPAAIIARMDELAAKIAEIRGALAQLDKRFDALDKKLDEIGQKIDTLASARPTAAPTPAPTATPAPTPTPTPTPTPKPTPTAPAVDVSTLTGAAEPGYVDGTKDVARFTNVTGLAWGKDDFLYAVDYGANAIRRINPADGSVTTVAGGSGPGHADGIGAAAKFEGPAGLAFDPDGVLYVSEWVGTVVRKVVIGQDGKGTVTTVAGAHKQAGFAPGTGSAARFLDPAGMVSDGPGKLLMLDTYNHVIWRIGPDGAAATFAGTGGEGFLDGKAGSAKFKQPIAMTFDGAGNLFVFDRGNLRLRKIDPAGNVTTVTGDGTLADEDGYAPDVKPGKLEGMSLHKDGRLICADPEHRKIKQFDPKTGTLVTLAGSGTSGRTDGTGDVARFTLPTGTTCAPDGTIYVADGFNIRAIKPR